MRKALDDESEVSGASRPLIAGPEPRAQHELRLGVPFTDGRQCDRTREALVVDERRRIDGDDARTDTLLERAARDRRDPLQDSRDDVLSRRDGCPLGEEGEALEVLPDAGGGRA